MPPRLEDIEVSSSGVSNAESELQKSRKALAESYIRLCCSEVAIEAIDISICESISRREASSRRLHSLKELSSVYNAKMRMDIMIVTSTPGAIIGRQGRTVKRLEREISALVELPVKISVREPKLKGAVQP